MYLANIYWYAWPACQEVKELKAMRAEMPFTIQYNFPPPPPPTQPLITLFGTPAT